MRLFSGSIGPARVVVVITIAPPHTAAVELNELGLSPPKNNLADTQTATNAPLSKQIFALQSGPLCVSICPVTDLSLSPAPLAFLF